MTDSDALKTYLNTNLTKLCEADSGPLTKYIMALLKKNKNQSELRSFLVEQLEVFLLKDTAAFVDQLLQALKNKAYLDIVPHLDGSKKADTSGTASSKNGVPDVLKKSKPSPEGDSKMQNLDKTANSDVASETKQERSRKTSSKRIRRNDSPPIISEASSVSPSLSREHEKDNNPIELPAKPFDTCIKSKPRCLDYDELGYCLKGACCRYSHGCDAIPLNMEDVSSLNFNVTSEELPPFEDGSSHTTGTRSISPVPPPLPTTSPPPPPPPPPPSMLLDAALGVLEPYNPESPGMTTYYSHTTPLSTHMGPTLSPSGPGISNVYGSRNETFHSKPHRIRELVCVSPCGLNTPHSENVNENTTQLKRKGTFDFSRLGPPKKLAKTDSILELRKVPRHLNTIAMLNSHFSSFGRILNLEIAYDSDPEAALVKFASPIEASNAYRSSVAIFNNRFIKVFYHRSNGANPLTSEKTQRKENSEKEAKEKDIFFDKLCVSHTHTHTHTHTPTQTKYAKGNVSRTVFIPNNRIFQKIPQKIPKKDPKKPFEIELELLRKKQGFLKDSIDHQKVILAKLMKSKNKKETEFLKKTIETISSKISALKSEIKNDSELLKNKLRTYRSDKKEAIESAHIVKKSEKELLDAEIDLYKKRGEKIPPGVLSLTPETKQTQNLLTQVKELKEKAKSLGLIDGSVPPHGGLGARHAKLKKHSTHGKISCPKQILVCGPIKDERDLLKHFEQFGNVENIEDKNPYNLITFSSRAEAEAAFLNGSKFDGTALNLVWFQERDPQYSTVQDTDNSESKPTNPDIVGDDEEEEEDDEDSEARSWRR